MAGTSRTAARRILKYTYPVLNLLLIPLLLLVGLPAPAHGAPFDTSEYADMVTPHDMDITISDDFVFRDEPFRVHVAASATLNKDLNFSTVLDVDYDVVAQRADGSQVQMRRFSTSIGPFYNLTAGTRLNYTLLDAPLSFPADAPAGDYDLYISLVRVRPDSIWAMVQANVDTSNLKAKLGSIEYLGIARPEISLTVDVPQTVNAGAQYQATVDVTAPGVEQVNLSLYQKIGRQSPAWLEDLSTGGSATVNRFLTAPTYGGELEISARVTSYVVQGNTIVPEHRISAGDEMNVLLAAPSLSLSVSNPQTVGQDVPFNVTVNNPSGLPLVMELDILPEWTIPSWVHGDERQFWGIERTVSLGAGETSRIFSLTAPPITVQGAVYRLAVESSRYQINGQWTAADPPLRAQAVVTTATTLAGQLAVSPEAVYPGESFGLDAGITNPGASDISVSYLVRLYVADSRDAVFDASPSTFQQGNIVVAAGATVSPALNAYVTTAAQAGKYLGFALYSNGILADQVITFVKPVSPPTVNMATVKESGDVGESIDLTVKLKNPMSVPIEFTVTSLRRVNTESGWVETVLQDNFISLAGDSRDSLRITTPLPLEPAIVEYGARVSGVTLSALDASFDVSAEDWKRIGMRSVVLPQVSLTLNPDPVQAGSSLEVRTSVVNPSTRDMVVPVDLYLKLPGSNPTLWKQESITVAAGQSASANYYLAVQTAWESFGNIRVILKINSFTWDSVTLPLNPAIEARQSVRILSLSLQAALRSAIAEYELAYDAASNYLAMGSVTLDGTIVISNRGGWDNIPDIPLKLEVISSQGVQIIDPWDVIETTSHGLAGDLATTARFSIDDPTADALGAVSFTARVTAGAVSQDFTLGLFRIADDDWRLDEDANLVDRGSGARFASRNWDSDGDGLSDYQEMMQTPATDPLDGTDPGSVSEAERQERRATLEAQVRSYIRDATEFIGTVAQGGTLLPNGNAAWQNMEQQGDAAQQSLDALKALTGLAYAEFTAQLAELRQQVDNLQGTVNEVYGDSATPRETQDEAARELVRLTVEDILADPDGDGLATGLEMALRYDPSRWDSQRTGMSDGDYFLQSLTSLRGSSQGPLQASFVAARLMQNLVQLVVQQFGDELENPGDIARLRAGLLRQLRNNMYQNLKDMLQ